MGARQVAHTVDGILPSTTLSKMGVLRELENGVLKLPRGRRGDPSNSGRFFIGRRAEAPKTDGYEEST
jgi:hypothetical protein